MAVTSSNKWVCPTCTYNNWQSWSKCVLCGSTKPIIDDVIPRTPGVAKYRQQYNPGWSKLGTSMLPGGIGAPVSPATRSLDLNVSSTMDSSHINTPQQVSKGTGRCKVKGKWVCVNCTYHNWPNTGHCTMCSAPRAKTIRNESPPRNEIGRTSSRTSDSILRYASGVGAVGGAAVGVDGYSDVPLHSGKSRNGRHNNRGGQGVSSDNKKKWKCLKCTYENWPKASKCTMCMRAKTRTPSPPLSGGDDSSPITPPPSSPQTLHSRSSSSSSLPAMQVKPTTNSNTSLRALSPSVSRAHSNSRDLSEAHFNSNEGLGSNANDPTISSNMQPTKEIRLTESGSCSSRGDRHISYGSDHYNSLSRQIQLKSNTDEIRQIRNTLSSSDWLFINACLGIINNDESAVKAYLRQDGDRARQLTKDECLVVGQPSTFTVGTTLVHLAIRFQRSELLSILLTPAPSDARKRLPSESNYDLASSIREEVSLSLHQHMGEWTCYFLTQITTFFLPADIRRFCLSVQKRVFDEIVDKDVNKELESELAIINWSAELMEDLGSKLYPLWNRTAGDCLLDSVLQATWGVVDRDSTLRRAMADSLVDGAPSFYERWKDSEQRLSQSQGFSLDEDQLKQDWAGVVALADQTGKSLERIHIFALAHILRRPIVVYGVRVVKNYRGENLGFANFEGVYLPLLWESSFCWKTPIALAYTRGHFSALVAMAPSLQSGSGRCSNQSTQPSHVIYMPLVDSEGRILCVHYLNEQEMGCEERLLSEYFNCHVTRLGTLTAKQEVSNQNSLVVSLVDQWLDRFRKMDKRKEGGGGGVYSSTYSDSGSDH